MPPPHSLALSTTFHGFGSALPQMDRSKAVQVHDGHSSMSRMPYTLPSIARDGAGHHLPSQPVTRPVPLMTGSNQHCPDDDGLPMPGEPLTPKVEPAGKAKKLPKPEKKKPATAAPAKKPEKKDNRGGHTSGSRNFNAEDMVRLVKIVGKVLPLGQTGWSTVEKLFNENSQLRRDHKSLKAKFDAVSAVAD